MLSKLQFPRPQSVPSGFPETIKAPWAWDGSEYQQCEEYILQLEKNDIEEIEGALKHFKGKPPTDRILQALFIKTTKV